MRRRRTAAAALAVLGAAAGWAVRLDAAPDSAAALHSRTRAAALPSDVGQWQGPFTWPLVAVHAVLQPTGDVLVWDGFANGPNSNRLWHPATGTFFPVPYARNLFCAGQIALADGRTVVFGGHETPFNGLPDTSVFDPTTNTWTRAADMARVRWYPTATTLADGRVLVVSGDAIVQDTTPPITPLSTRSNTVPAIYNPRSNTWTSLSAAARAMPLYPQMFVLPDGRVFDAGPDQTTRTLDLASGTWTVVGTSPIDGHSAVMYRPGKILKTGKWADPDYPNLTVHGRAAVIDMNQPSPVWREVAPMAFRRSYHNLVALPDGNVLVVGGGTSSDGVTLSSGVHEAELWNANTETWTTMASEQVSRLYHSTAVLLPDARVLVAGGGALPGSATDQTSAEIYSPPYLFRGARPTITSAPGTAQYGVHFSVTTPDADRVASVALVRTAAVTHAFDQNQRYVPLTFTAASGSLDVQAPANANIAPPGYYLLFIVDTTGVPSVATFVRLPAPWEDTAAPTAPSSLVATGGVGAIGLTWASSLDNIGIAHYNVHRSTVSSFTPSAANRVAQPTGTSYTDSGLAAGTYYYVVTAEDAAGNVSGPSNLASATSTADTTAPTVAISAPAASATVSGTVTVSADASDDVAVAAVQFFVDGSPIDAEDRSAPFSVSWITGSVSNGSHTLTAIARDPTGNQKTSAPVSVTVANSAPTGLVAAYSFDAGSGSSVVDVSGNGNVGAISGAVWTAAGRFGSALSFNGSSSWVTVADASSLDLAAGMTLEAWVRPAVLGAVWRTVVLKEQTGELVYGLYANSQASRPYGIAFTQGVEQQAAGAAQLPLNAWTHLAAVYDGGSVRLFVNGVQVGSRITSGLMPNSGGALRIGGNSVWGEWFSGLIDEVRIYNRALTSSEIQTDMNTALTP